jgi:non-heme chloroperoxidase
MSMSAGFPAAYECIKAFSETEFTDDLKKFDIPTLVIHGDDDQIVPITVGGLRSVKLIAGAELKVYKGAPHGLMSTNKEQFNADLLAFAREESQTAETATRVRGGDSRASEIAPPPS